MSLLSKFTSIFSSSSTTDATTSPSVLRLEEVLTQIFKFSLKFELRTSMESLLSYFAERDEHIEVFFRYLQYDRLKKVSSHSLIHLFMTIHQAYLLSDLMYEIAMKLRETRLSWLMNADDQKVSSVQFLTQADESPQLNFVQQYYSYLQRIAANVDLFRSIQKNHYPYVSSTEQIEPKLMFLWLYKIQNTLNTGMSLLKYDPLLADAQKLIYEDLWKFQNFLCLELGKTVDYYATLPNQDTMSLYEVYMDSQKHYDILKKFQSSAKILNLQEPSQVLVNNGILQDFLNFVSRLKVLNQMVFKKSLKVPNKANPCMGVPLHNPNVQHLNLYMIQVLHLRATSGQQKKAEDQGSSDDEEEEDHEVHELQQNSQKKKKQHLRGISTFQLQ